MEELKFKKIKKSKKILLVCVFIVAASILSLLVFIAHVQISCKDFFNASFRQFEVPEIHSGFVPQGIDYFEDENIFLISGYKSDGSSKIYVIYSDKKYREISIVDYDGKEFINHAGGISSFGEYVYVAGCDGKCYVLNLDELMNENSCSAKIIGSFSTYNNADFCYINDNYLYVGEYAHSIKYITDSSHHITTPGGDENNAIITVFELSQNNVLGVADIPKEVYSARGIAQGMCITSDDKLILSTSALYATSHIYVYDYDKMFNGQKDSFFIDDVSVPIYYLDSESLSKDIKVPPKAEGLFFGNNKLYIVFESASNRFILGKFIGGEYVYSMEL